MIAFKDVYDLRTLLMYCSEHLNWSIDDEYFDDLDELTYDFEPSDLGIKEDAFVKINSLKQLRPLSDDQPWGIFSVDFDSKNIEISALRKILNKLVTKSKGADYKTWDCDHLMFLCFWGQAAYRTIGFVVFDNSKNQTIPSIKALYCAPKIEDRAHIEDFEKRISSLKWPDYTNNEQWINDWSSAFQTKYHQVVRDTKTLTERLANIAISIRENMSSAFNVEEYNGNIHQLYTRFNSALKLNLSSKEFIDMYSQTIVYGLFSARCMKPDVYPFTIETAIECIPLTNPLLRELLAECCTQTTESNFDELEVLDLIELLNVSQIHDILRDFNRQTGLGKEDPIVYFYEGFLDLYEKEQKKRRGVYYTPMPVVDFIVSSISNILKAKFKCDEGFLDENVSVLDPAAGTGTFLRKVIYEVFDEFQKNRTHSSWSEYVPQSLLSRIFGFEFMMAPYAVAHMKLAMTLQDTGYDFSSENRLQVFLANSLENTPDSPSPTQLEDPLVKESSYAARARQSKINVILGNPPYRTDSINKSPWIMELMETYKHEPGTSTHLKERNPKVVNDDYVKFIRFSQDLIKNRERAVIAFIHPHSYMDNLTFRGMRWSLLKNFQEIFILDLHGNAMSRETFDVGERDENVFDIQQGVCISFFVRNRVDSAESQAKVYYSELVGSRIHKYEALKKLQFEDIPWKEVQPSAPYYFFKPKDLSNADIYNSGVKLSELFPVNIGGIKTHDDAHLVSDLSFNGDFDQPYDYRPFDTKHINYDLDKVERPRYEVMKHFIGHSNFGLVIDRQVVTDNWSHVQFVTHMIDNRLHYSRKGIPVVCPLYLFDENGTRTSNIDTELLSNFVSRTGLCFTEEDTVSNDKFNILNIADYCYAVLFSQSYRDTYSNLLSIDFPRVPYPTSKEVFWKLAQKGKLLRELHTLSVPVANNLNIVFEGTGNNEITSLKYVDRTVKINQTQYFSNIPAEVWDFCFGGYHGLQKWFKDHRHMILSTEDVHYLIAVFNVFDQTITVMDEIEEVLIDFGIVFD